MLQLRNIMAIGAIATEDGYICEVWWSHERNLVDANKLELS